MEATIYLVFCKSEARQKIANQTTFSINSLYSLLRSQRLLHSFVIFHPPIIAPPRMSCQLHLAHPVGLAYGVLWGNLIVGLPSGRLLESEYLLRRQCLRKPHAEANTWHVVKSPPIRRARSGL